jgi:hypothetical protein
VTHFDPRSITGPGRGKRWLALAKGFFRRPRSTGRLRMMACLPVLTALLALLWGRLPQVPEGAAALGAATALDVADDAAECAVLAAPRAIANVARAPLLERLAVAWPVRLCVVRNFARTTAKSLPDRRRELRRVQTRRSVPRMNSEEPPWA